MKVRPLVSAFIVVVSVGVMATSLSGQGQRQGYRGKSHGNIHGSPHGDRGDGRRLFERETFGGNGRTCLTCHSRKTGTVSPQDALARFNADSTDPLFLHDGSDDGLGNGVTRMLTDATILINIPLPPNVRLGDDPTARFVTLRRGIPTTLNTPALDPVLMLDGRQPTLELQAGGAIRDHGQVADDSPDAPTLKELELIKQFEQTDAFFSSPALRFFALGGPPPRLPRGHTASERRGRRFFEDVEGDPAQFFKPGLCAHCHSGSMMNQTSKFAPSFFGVPVKTGTRFQNILVSAFNHAGNPVREFIFTQGGVDISIFSPDPGRALITGIVDDPITFENIDAFKISSLRGIRHTAPYFHDNSAETLNDVVAHYKDFFLLVTGGFIDLTDDQDDIVAFLKLLD